MSEFSPASVRVVILAGGFGTRVRHLLTGVPKPMAPVCGRPFVEWVVRFYAQVGLNDFILSTGYLADVVADHFAREPVPGVKVSCCAELWPLGTAGGFLNCVTSRTPSTDAIWLVVNGDSLVFTDPREMLADVQTGRSEAALLGLAAADASRYGSLDISPEGRLKAFLEKRPGAGVVNAGVYVFSQGAVSRMPMQRPLSFETDVFPRLASGGRVAVQTVSAPFLDIGTPETLAEAENFITSNKTQFLP
jgi:D-glycero-alpha-D-manno-heptose 1-phosphate guanylyltransferase